LQLVAKSCTICSSRAKRPVRKFLDTPSYNGSRNRGVLTTVRMDVSYSFIVLWSRPGQYPKKAHYGFLTSFIGHYITSQLIW